MHRNSPYANYRLFLARNETFLPFRVLNLTRLMARMRFLILIRTVFYDNAHEFLPLLRCQSWKWRKSIPAKGQIRTELKANGYC